MRQLLVIGMMVTIVAVAFAENNKVGASIARPFSCIVQDAKREIKLIPISTINQYGNGTVSVIVPKPETHTTTIITVDPSNIQGTFGFREYNLRTGEEIYNSDDMIWVDQPEQSFFEFSSFGNDFKCGPSDDLLEIRDAEGGGYFMTSDGFTTTAALYDFYVKERLIDFSTNKKSGKRPIFKINSPSVIVVTHPVKNFDKGNSKGPFQKFFNAIRDRNIPVVGLFQNLIFPKYYSNIPQEHFDFFGNSSGGEHEFDFSESRSIVVVGGYFEQCLCETLQGLFRNTKKGNSIDLILPKELVTLANWEPVHRIFLPEIPTETAKEKLDLATTLDQFEKLAPSKRSFQLRLLEGVRQLILGQGFSEGKNNFCPYQKDGILSSLNYQVEIFDRTDGFEAGVKIGTIGSGDKKVRLYFIPQSTVPDYLNDLRGPIQAIRSDVSQQEMTIVPSRKTR